MMANSRAKPRVFISFDFDHDEDLRNLLVGQAKNSYSPFEISDWSVKDSLSGNWREKVRSRIRRTELTIVICGKYTHTASGVAAEVTIAREEGKPYFLLKGRNGKTCTKPASARENDEIHEWTWNNLRKQIEGESLLESLAPWLLVAGLAGLAVWIGSQKVDESMAQEHWTRGIDNRNGWV